MSQPLIFIDAFQDHIDQSTTVSIRRRDREYYYHQVSPASLRRLVFALNSARYADRVHLRPWSSCLGWSATIRI